MNERSTISARIWVFDGEVSPVFSSLNLRTLRELSLGFGTIKASSWRYSGQLPGVSPVFDRTETILGEMFFPTRQASKAVSGSASPPRARSRVRYHQGIFLALQRSNTEGLPSIRSYRKLFWWTSFPNSPGPRAVSGSASPPRARSRVRYHHGIFLAL